MKKSIILITLLLFASACLAADFSANLKIQTGDASLDLHLRNVNSKASTPAGAGEVRTELREKYSVTERELKFLGKQGYTLAEIQYLALLAKQSRKSITNVAALRSKGIGWGVLAKRLGVRPSALRKLIVKEKMLIKERAKEKPPLRIHAPEKFQMREAPGMKKEMGKGRGH